MATKKRFYSESEKQLESRDSGMLSDDKSAIANMPQDVKYHEWPRSASYAQYELTDTIAGVDAQMRDDAAGAKRHRSKTKY